MPKVIVVGAGPVGLATAMLLAKDGHDVTVLEKDDARTPATADEAWGSWQRKGVAQLRAAHYMQAKFRHVLDAELPEVRDELARLGGCRHSLIGGFAYTIADPTPRPGDERFETITARRPIIDAAFARVAEDTPGVTILRGVGADGPTTNGSGNAHVTGVRTTDGREIAADLVVDTRGRRSNIGEWITGIGGRAPYEEATDAGFTYYTRHYRSRDGSRPEPRGTYFTLLHTITILTVPTDADTWMVAIVCSSGDMPLKAVRRPDAWERVVRSIPHLTHWLDGEPVQDIAPMAGVLDRYRRFVVDDEPVVTGLVAVGDAWACTNPQAGRGISTGLRHAVTLRDVVRQQGNEDPRDLAVAFDRATEETCTPWYHLQLARDRIRYDGIQAVIEGREPVAPTDPVNAMQVAFNTAAAYDPDICRAALEVFGCLALPQEVLARPGVIDRVMSIAAEHEPPETEAPTREQLVAIANG